MFKVCEPRKPSLLPLEQLRAQTWAGPRSRTVQSFGNAARSQVRRRGPAKCGAGAMDANSRPRKSMPSVRNLLRSAGNNPQALENTTLDILATLKRN